jgi:ABC-type transporter Mla maintaining outer membrane lipid asymmetry permease subunit MlaE
MIWIYVVGWYIVGLTTFTFLSISKEEITIRDVIVGLIFSIFGAIVPLVTFIAWYMKNKIGDKVIWKKKH